MDSALKQMLISRPSLTEQTHCNFFIFCLDNNTVIKMKNKITFASFLSLSIKCITLLQVQPRSSCLICEWVIHLWISELSDWADCLCVGSDSRRRCSLSLLMVPEGLSRKYECGVKWGNITLPEVFVSWRTLAVMVWLGSKLSLGVFGWRM